MIEVTEEQISKLKEAGSKVKDRVGGILDNMVKKASAASKGATDKVMPGLSSLKKYKKYTGIAIGAVMAAGVISYLFNKSKEHKVNAGISNRGARSAIKSNAVPSVYRQSIYNTNQGPENLALQLSNNAQRAKSFAQ